MVEVLGNLALVKQCLAVSPERLCETWPSLIFLYATIDLIESAPEKFSLVDEPLCHGSSSQLRHRRVRKVLLLHRVEIFLQLLERAMARDRLHLARGRAT